jgi:hypothetical protein
MGCDETLASLDEDVEDLAPAALPLREPILERRSLHPVHDQVDLVQVGPSSMYRHHVGIVEPGHGLGLAQEAGLGLLDPSALALRPQELDGYLAIELWIVGGVDRPMPPSPNRSSKA